VPSNNPIGLAKVKKVIRGCRKCGLFKDRINIVFGEGPENANIMFVGEAPGASENFSGRPFVGPAGKLLNEILSKVSLCRKDVFITNVVKCRPSNNRDPLPEEIAQCEKFLHAQIFHIKPKLIIAIGRFAGNLLSGQSGVPMGELKKQLWDYHNNDTGYKTKVAAIYHPAYMLRNRGNDAGKEAAKHAVTILKEQVSGP